MEVTTSNMASTSNTDSSSNSMVAMDNSSSNTVSSKVAMVSKGMASRDMDNNSSMEDTGSNTNNHKDSSNNRSRGKRL